MHTLNATFEVSSPMFIAGYDNSSDSAALDIRPTAIKGALRFWWRAIHYAQFQQKTGSQQQALKAMHTAEQLLFGSAANSGNKSGQSLVLLRIINNIQEKDVVKSVEDRTNNGCQISSKQGCCYLLGQGLFRSKLLRPYIKHNTVFEIQLGFKPMISQEQIQQVKQALLAFGLLGNLGTRARKGFGSISVTQLTENGQQLTLPGNKEEYINVLNSFFSSAEHLTSLPPFTAFSAFSHSDISVVGSDPVKVLNEVGEKQQMYRSYGQDKSDGYKVGKEYALQLFSDDHHGLYKFAEDNQEPCQPRRLVFGIPNNIRFSRAGEVKIEIAEKSTARRASPLFIHIHRIDNEFLAVQSMLAAQFLPDNTRLKYSKKNGSSKSSKLLLPKPVQWQVITDYLTLPRYEGKNHGCDGFTNRIPVFKGSKL